MVFTNGQKDIFLKHLLTIKTALVVTHTHLMEIFMTKSIEEQAREYVESKICFNGLEYSVGGNTYNECFRSFLVGAKARDAEIQQLKSKLAKAKKALEFYADDFNWLYNEIKKSDCEEIKFNHVLKKPIPKGLEFEAGGKKARQALSEINDDAVFAKCEYCKKPVDGHLAEHYKEIEVFCSLKCNQEYMGD